MRRVLFMILFLFLLSSAVRCQTIKEHLPDGSMVIEYQGVEYRALPPALIRNILKDRNDLAITKQEFANYKIKSNELIESIKMAQKLEIETLTNDRNFWQKKFQDIDKDRLNYAGKLSKCTGKVLLVRFCWF